MQFTRNGPDIPDALMQAHEDGRVVFFCGAGISYPAGLPGFKGLVDEIYRRCDTAHSESEYVAEHIAYIAERYDATLDLLERRLPGRRTAMRRALADALTPNLRRHGATSTHSALLRLGRNQDGVLRLVTTNFDRVFHAAARRTSQAFQPHCAPMIPIPKNSRWNGVVYLHGLLPEKPDDAALNRLVVTSGDFGLAYLTERWAARFVSELFRRYVVCFIGYSINDPVLRYMMDALAADRMMGEAVPQAWAFGDFQPGKEKEKIGEWRAKGVAPILYEVPSGTYDHSALHDTLHAWADTYRDGLTGKERIVVANAMSRPSASTLQDDFVGRMLWAISDPSGLPARRFADFNPAPSLDWLLDAFAVRRYRHADLVRFGIQPQDEVDADLSFSLSHRPTPYQHSAWMGLVAGHSHSPWDKVMIQLGRWLLRHLNSPRLIIWIAQHGAQLQLEFKHQIEARLEEIAELQRKNRVSELDEMCANAPDAIPSPWMRVVWRLLIQGRVKSLAYAGNLYEWKRKLDLEGLTSSLRWELRELLAPKIRLRRLSARIEELDDICEPQGLRRLIDWELVLAADHVHAALRDISDDHWRSALPWLLDDLQQLLRDALDLQKELGEAKDQFDQSYWYLPSISPHWQNRGFHEWVSLIELLRQAWLVVLSADSSRASRIAMTWFELPYLAFKRLALFAASQDQAISPERWVDWLLSDGACWLWADEARREVSRLLAEQGQNLMNSTKDRLESAILVGPSREMFKQGLEHDQLQGRIARPIWLRLAKLRESGLSLGASSCTRLSELEERYKWKFSKDQQEEFPFWMGGPDDPDYQEDQQVENAPRDWRRLVHWLSKREQPESIFCEDTWRDVCRTRFFHSVYAFHILGQQGIWPIRRWREALEAWSEKALLERSRRHVVPLVLSMPDETLRDLAHGLSWWLKAVSKSTNEGEAALLQICERLMDLPLDSDSATQNDHDARLQQSMTAAINHPMGHVAQSLINLWFTYRPSDNDGLPPSISRLLTRLCDVRIQRFHSARMLLASQLIAFYRVDRRWTEKFLLPRFDWKVDPAEAKDAWAAFLWSPRLYQPVLLALKPQFLETARHYAELGELGRQYAAFLTYAALDQLDGYTPDDWRVAIANLPLTGLKQSAQALVQALEGAASRREEYWKNRIQPFWKSVWPKSLDLVTEEIAESLAELCIAAGSNFSSALDMVQNWLRPIGHPNDLVARLHESGLCSQFPVTALRMLAAIIGKQRSGASRLIACLEIIVQTDADLVSSADYRRLHEYAMIGSQ